MDKSKEQLLEELKELREQHLALKKKHKKEISKLQAEKKALQLRLMFLEGIANSTIDGFLVVNPNGKKILQNQRTIELWKIPKEVAEDPSGLKQISHVMYMTVNPKQFVAEIDYLREHPEAKSRDELELIDGTILDRYSSPVIGPDGKNYGRIWTFHDVTERKKIEKHLVRLNTDKDRFISILAHDLRSPFSSLLGFSDLLMENIRTYPIEKIQNMVEIINSAAHKTFELLEDTLLWASIKTQKLVFNPTNTNVSEIISEIADILLPAAKAKNITVSYDGKSDMKIYADVYMLKAIIRNLVSNSIKFTNTGGQVLIQSEKKDNGIIVKVVDNGVGMQPETIKNLFDISSIQSTKGTAHETGTGMGLLLCKEFVDRHKGKITVKSEVNNGTKVSFTIPGNIKNV